MAVKSPNNGWKLAVMFLAGALFGSFTVIQVSRNITTTTVAHGSSTDPGAVETSPTGASSTLLPGALGAANTASGGQATGSSACAPGRNGDATAPGVTSTEIKLATTVVRSGIGAAFLGDVQYAMEAVRNRVNRAGGICGRQISVRYVDDGWDASRGAQFLRSFIRDNVFAIPVGPSSEGLRVVIDSGDIQRAGIPVVGTDGMLIDQYKDSWVWPVAIATASSARIMAQNAYKRGARTFAIVFDKNYRFGVEAAAAYNNEVRRLTGSDVLGYNSENNCVKRFCGVLAGQPGYSNEVNEVASQDFNFLAMFLEPQTALTWMSTPGAPTADPSVHAQGVGLAQPLFTRDFAVNCQAACDQMWVWTGYKPPIEDYADDSIVKAYVSDLRKTSSTVDVYNAFAEGGYVGMSLLVKALESVGPNLTRERLKAALDSIAFASGLTLDSSLSWRPGDHFAGRTMQAFSIEYKGTFGGWRAQSIVADPTPQRGIG